MKFCKLATVVAVCTIATFSSCHTRGDYVCICADGLTGSYYEEREVSGKSKKDGRNKCQAMGQPAGTPDGIICDLRQ